MNKNVPLIFYYDSTDKDVTLARNLIEQLEGMEVELHNAAKNTIVQTIQQIYGQARTTGQTRTAAILQNIAESNNEKIPDILAQYIESFAGGNFENEAAFDRSKARISKDQYYLGIAEAVLARSTCLRRRYGAVIVKDDEILATGYNGSPRGERNCIDNGFCNREANNIPKGERYEMCSAVHAEQNALLSVARKDAIGATIYIAGREVKTWEYANPEPCLICAKQIKQMGITRVVGIYKGGIVEFPHVVGKQ